MDRDPEPEVARPEGEALLQREDVAAHVVDGVGGGFVVEDEQVVLPEHALREVAEEHAGLGARDPPADGSHPARRHALADPCGERREQVLHRRHVGRHPGRPVDHLGPRRTGGLQPGVGGDQGLGLGGDRFEVVAQRTGEVAGGQRLATAEAARHLLGQRPVDRVVDRTSGRRFGHRDRRGRASPAVALSHEVSRPRCLGRTTLT